MDDTVELTERFERYCDTKDNDVPSEVLNELQSIQRIFSISAEELDFKWQAYHMKMGGDENKLDLKRARDFKKDLQDSLEKESRGRYSRGAIPSEWYRHPERQRAGTCTICT
jgi:DNA polymerase alpha subunit B